jgi:hypothetical protein
MKHLAPMGRNAKKALPTPLLPMFLLQMEMVCEQMHARNRTQIGAEFRGHIGKERAMASINRLLDMEEYQKQTLRNEGIMCAFQRWQLPIIQQPTNAKKWGRIACVPAPAGHLQTPQYFNQTQIQTAEHGKHLLAENVIAAETHPAKRQLDAIGVALEQHSIQAQAYRLTLQALGMTQKQEKFTPQ